jgi:hypothetical protein
MVMSGGFSVIAGKSTKKLLKEFKRLTPRRHEGHEEIKLRVLRVFVVNKRLLIACFPASALSLF